MDRRTLYVDCDDSILMHDLSEFPIEDQVTIRCNYREFVGVPNKKNIKLLIKFYKLGYEICVWSKTGKSWALAVCERLGVNEYVSFYLTKPDFLIDDMEPSKWLGVRLWRDPVTGEFK